MLNSIKKAMATAAVVAVGALAGPAMASAAFPDWDPAGAAYSPGHLTTYIGGLSVGCTVDATLDLANDGTADGGEVTSFALSDCESNFVGCTVTATADLNTPWQLAKVAGNAGRVGIAGISYAFEIGGGWSCPVNGERRLAGTLVGDYDAATGELLFQAAPGLTSAFVTGSLWFVNTATDQPVGLEL